MLLKNDGVLPLKRRSKIAVIGPHGGCDARAARQLFLVDVGPAGLAAWRACAAHCPARGSLQCRSQPITDGDPVPTSALRTPDGKPGLRAEYFDVAEPHARVTRRRGVRERARR